MIEADDGGGGNDGGRMMPGREMDNDGSCCGDGVGVGGVDAPRGVLTSFCSAALRGPLRRMASNSLCWERFGQVITGISAGSDLFFSSFRRGHSGSNRISWETKCTGANGSKDGSDQGNRGAVGKKDSALFCTEERGSQGQKCCGRKWYGGCG